MKCTFESWKWFTVIKLKPFSPISEWNSSCTIHLWLSYHAFFSIFIKYNRIIKQKTIRLALNHGASLNNSFWCLFRCFRRAQTKDTLAFSNQPHVFLKFFFFCLSHDFFSQFFCSFIVTHLKITFQVRKMVRDNKGTWNSYFHVYFPHWKILCFCFCCVFFRVWEMLS